MIRLVVMVSAIALGAGCSLGGLDSPVVATPEDSAGVDGGDAGSDGDGAYPDATDVPDADPPQPDLPDADADVAELDATDSDAALPCADDDDDGYGEGPGCLDTDCDDSKPDIHGPTVWYADSDEDGHGDELDKVAACERPEGYVAEAGDCRPSDPDFHPLAPDICDLEDNDCDGAVDEDPDLNFWPDADEDSFGDRDAEPVTACAVEGFVQNNRDCDDDEEHTHPDADEDCTDTDRNCDEDLYADAVDAPMWYRDLDNDSWGNEGDVIQACSQPQGYVARGEDCRDDDENVHPDADELCDVLDRNCDGEAALGAVDTETYYVDGDGDDWGLTDVSVEACSRPANYAARAGDCDDSRTEVYPGSHTYDAPGDGIDADCDGNDACLDYGCDAYQDLIYANGSGLYAVPSSRDAFPLEAPIFVSEDASAVGDIGTGDFNGDGFLDLITAFGPADLTIVGTSLVFYGGETEPQFLVSARIDTAPSSCVVVADFNGDGYDDFVIAEGDVMENDFNEQTLTSIRYGGREGLDGVLALARQPVRWVSVGDLGTDPYPDLALSVGETSVRLQHSETEWNTASATILAANDSRFNLFEDFDGDGTDDILVVNAGQGTTFHTVFYGPSMQASTSFAAGPSEFASTEDINGDGRLDIAFAQSAGMPVVFMSAEAPRSWVRHAIAFGGATRVVRWFDLAGSWVLAAPNGADGPGQSYFHRVQTTDLMGGLTFTAPQQLQRYDGSVSAMTSGRFIGGETPEMVLNNLMGSGTIIVDGGYRGRGAGLPTGVTALETLGR